MNRKINYELINNKRIIFTSAKSKKEIAIYDVDTKELNLFLLRWNVEDVEVIVEVINVFERFLEKKKLIDEEIYDLFNGDDEDEE